MKLLKTRSFTWQDVGALKITLISIGILCGVYYTKFFADSKSLWWVIAVTGSVYFLARYSKEK